jgi:hypothetical protein
MGALSRKPTTNLLLFHFLLFLLLLFAARVVRLVRTAVRIFARVRRRRRPAALLLRLLLVLHLAGSREKFPIRLAVGVFRLDRLEGCTRFPETDRIHSPSEPTEADRVQNAGCVPFLETASYTTVVLTETRILRVKF